MMRNASRAVAGEAEPGTAPDADPDAGPDPDPDPDADADADADALKIKGIPHRKTSPGSSFSLGGTTRNETTDFFLPKRNVVVPAFVPPKKFFAAGRFRFTLICRSVYIYLVFSDNTGIL